MLNRLSAIILLFVFADVLAPLPGGIYPIPVDDYVQSVLLFGWIYL